MLRVRAVAPRFPCWLGGPGKQICLRRRQRSHGSVMLLRSQRACAFKHLAHAHRGAGGCESFTRGHIIAEFFQLVDAHCALSVIRAIYGVTGRNCASAATFPLLRSKVATVPRPFHYYGTVISIIIWPPRHNKVIKYFLGLPRSPAGSRGLGWHQKVVA